MNEQIRKAVAACWDRLLLLGRDLTVEDQLFPANSHHFRLPLLDHPPVIYMMACLLVAKMGVVPARVRSCEKCVFGAGKCTNPPLIAATDRATGLVSGATGNRSERSLRLFQPPPNAGECGHDFGSERTSSWRSLDVCLTISQ